MGRVTALFLSERDVAELLPVDDAIAAVEQAFRLLTEDEAVNAPRQRSRAGVTTLNVMWAIAPSLDVMGVKTYPVTRTDVSKGSVLTVVLYACSSGDLLGVIEADLLGQRRTAAASAVATRALARPESETLAVFGAGYQAEAQVRAVARVLPRLRCVRVVGRSPARRDAFVASLRDELGLDVRVADPEEAVRSADVIVTATGSTEPLFDGAWMRPGTHVNAIGSNLPTGREVDRATLTRAARIAVDAADVAASESGDLLLNGVPVQRTTELGRIVVGAATGRRSSEDITVFESQGLAVQDVVCGAHILRRAREGGRGQRLPLVREMTSPWPAAMPPASRGASGGGV